MGYFTIKNFRLIMVRLLLVISVLVLFAGCITPEKSSIFRSKQLELKVFNLSLSRMTINCTTNINTYYTERLKILLSEKLSLQGRVINKNYDLKIVELGVWLGISGKKYFAKDGMIKVYSCSLIVAVKGEGFENGKLLVNQQFELQRPIPQKTSEKVDEDAVIEEALRRCVDVISEQARLVLELCLNEQNSINYLTL